MANVLPPKDFIIFALAALFHATAENQTPQLSFAQARVFMARAEKEIPGITKALENP